MRVGGEGGAIGEGRYQIKGEQFCLSAQGVREARPKGQSVKGFCHSAHCHSKLSLSNREMLSMLAEGKRSFWSVGLL